MGAQSSEGSLIEEVSELVKLTKELKITELRIERGAVKIHLRRSSDKEPDAISIFEQIETPEESPSRHVTVLAPMVGRFYRSVQPSGEPLVYIGQEVSKGQRLCIIESMKVLNDVISEFEGMVVAILTEDGHGVEFGQPLFEIDTCPHNEGPVADHENSHS